MPGRADYTEQEWLELLEAPLWAAAAVAAVDFHLVAAFREFLAVNRAMAAANARHPDGLLGAVVESLNAPGAPAPPLAPEHQELDAVLRRIRAASALASRQPPAEAEAYRRFVFELAEVAARASGSGPLGGGPLVSDAEARYLAQLRFALQL